MSRVRHDIQLKLSSAGFSAEEIGVVLPDFMVDRKTLVGLTWYPCAEGTERFVLVVTIYSVVGAVAKIFLEELSKDLYQWVKVKINRLLKKKPQAYGMMLVKFNDVEVEFRTSGGDDWADLLDKLPSIIQELDPAESKDWEIVLKDGGFITKTINYKNK